MHDESRAMCMIEEDQMLTMYLQAHSLRVISCFSELLLSSIMHMVGAIFLALKTLNLGAIFGKYSS